MIWTEFFEKYFHTLEFISFSADQSILQIEQMYEMKLIVTAASIIY